MSTDPDIESCFQRIRLLYSQDKLLQASRLLDNLIDRLQAANESQHLERLSLPPFKSIADECSEVTRLQQALRSDEDWTLSYDGAETKVHYRKESSTNSHTIRTTGVIRAPLLNVAALIYEADLYEHLFWYVTSATVLPSVSNSVMRRATHLQVYAPFPLYKRDAAVFAYGCDALDEDNCVVVVSRSIRDADYIDVPEVPYRHVRVQMHISGFELVPLKNGVTKATFLYNVDPRLQYIPVGLINWAARTLCRWSLRVLEARARNLNAVSEEYAKRMVAGAFYEHIRGRLDEYWQRNGHAQGDAAAVENASDGGFDADVIPEAPSGWVIRQLLGKKSETDDDQPAPERKLSRRRALARYVWGGS